jgi:hypothetical protein
MKMEATISSEMFVLCTMLDSGTSTEAVNLIVTKLNTKQTSGNKARNLIYVTDTATRKFSSWI